MFDSDTILITDDNVLTRCAAKYYNTFKVPTMIVDSAKKKRHYTSADKASLDEFCDNDNIGIIVNLSQEINTIMWDRINRYGNWSGAMSAYYDNCLLSILSMLAIDSTKREYPIDCIEELKIVRARYNEKDDEDRAIRPKFFAHVAKKKGYYDPKRKNYKLHMAPMDYLQDVVDKFKNCGPKKGKVVTRTIGDIVRDLSINDVPRYGYVDLVLSMVRDLDANTRMLYQMNGNFVTDKEKKREMANALFEKCINGIRTLNLNKATIRELLIEMDNPANSIIRRKLWMILFGSLGDKVDEVLLMAEKPTYTFEECASQDDADVYMYNIPFKKREIEHKTA